MTLLASDRSLLRFYVEEESNSMKWLQTSRAPVELVYAHWKKSFNLRLQFLKGKCNINSILSAWPILATPICPNLVIVK